jgi:hypothetical protein
MPMHDWTQVDSGIYHDFHQGWTIEIRNSLNRGLLPPGYFAMADQRVSGPEPDVITFQTRAPKSTDSGQGLAVLDTPPHTQLVAKLSSDNAVYARKANRIAIRQKQGRVVSIIEIVSPGNKDNKAAIASFRSKLIEFLQAGIHVLIIDPFPPSPRDPDGIHQVIWDELVGEPFPKRPENKPLTAASYDAGDDFTAYVEPFAVGDLLPEMPLFLEPGWYIPVPIEKCYMQAWDALATEVREMVSSNS